MKIESKHFRPDITVVKNFGEVVVEVAEIDPIVLPYDPNSADKKLTIGEKGFANWRSRKEHKSKPQRLPKDTKSQDKNAPGYPWP